MMVPSQRLLLVAALVVVPAATVAGLSVRAAPVALGVLALCAAAAAADAVWGGRLIRALGLRTPDYLRLTKDVPANLPVTVENLAPLALPIRLAAVMPRGIEAEKPALDATVPPGASQLQWPCTGRTRGNHPLDELYLETPSPLGLWTMRAPRAVRFTFRVYPNLRDRATASLFLGTAQAGLRTRRQVGKGREFDNLRHYVAGDSYEDIHWKATARRGFPVVKLYRVEHAQEVYAVIDTSRLNARENILDGYVDAALHLALVAQRQGDRFGLVTFNDRTQRLVRARNGMDHFRLCRETIYGLRAERVSPDFREVFTSLQLNLRRRSLLVFFTSLDDALLAEAFDREIPLLARRHLVRVVVTRTAGIQPLFAGEPPGSIDAVYERLAGQMLSNRMRMLQLALENRGVRLTIADPQRIKAQVTAEYLDVKRRQVL